MSNETSNVKSISVRKAIPQSVRFEVFKRDSFACQYCGRKAPDVVLHVDHIRPVADGGQNDIINLVTACAECNGGKGARALDDLSILDRQRRQLEDLNERRNQLEMLVQWRENLYSLAGDYLKSVQNEFLKYGPYTANETAELEIAKWVRKYQMAELFSAIETSFTQYLRRGDDGEVTGDSWSRAFDMVPRIIETNRKGGLAEPMKSIFYARGILRNRLRFVRERDLVRFMKSAVDAGLPTDDLIEMAKTARNWSQFRSALNEWTAGY